MIISANKHNSMDAGRIHAEAWKESHRNINMQ